MKVWLLWKGRGVLCLASTRRRGRRVGGDQLHRHLHHPRHGAGGRDLASSVGGGGLKLGRGAGLEDCLARSGRLTRLVEGPGCWLDARLCRCRENPGCLWYTWDSRDRLCHLKSGRGYQRSRSPALYRTHPGAPCRPLVTPYGPGMTKADNEDEEDKLGEENDVVIPRTQQVRLRVLVVGLSHISFVCQQVALHCGPLLVVRGGLAKMGGIYTFLQKFTKKSGQI